MNNIIKINNFKSNIDPMSMYWALEFKLADIADNMRITRKELNKLIPTLPKDIRSNIHSIILEQIHLLRTAIKQKNIQPSKCKIIKFIK